MLNEGILLGTQAIKTGSKVAASLAKGATNVLEKNFGDLEERTCPVGGDFKKLDLMPLRLKQKYDICQEIAKTLESPKLKTKIDEIASFYSAPLFKVLILGNYNTGKSSLLNALLGKDVLPTGSIPTTKVLTWIVPGQNNLVVTQDDHSHFNILEFKDLTDPLQKDKFDKCQNVFITANLPLLEAGVSFMDTPGLEDSDALAVQRTKDAIEEADAIIYMTGIYSSAKDTAFLKDLYEKGRTKDLFIIINKMDQIPEEERKEFIGDKIGMFNQIGITANIYPISLQNRENDNDFMTFSMDLRDFISNGMRQARDGMTEGKLDLLLDNMKEVCGNINAMNQTSGIENDKIREKMFLDAEIIRRANDKFNNKLDKELDMMESKMLFNWERFSSNLKNEINEKIENASIAELKRRDFIENIILKETFSFLNQEVQDAQASFDSWIKENWETSLTPKFSQEFNLGNAKTNEIFNIPKEIVPAGMIVISFMTFGFFAALKTTIFAIIGKSLIEGVFSSLNNFVETASLRRQLRAVLEQKWPLLDQEVRDKFQSLCQYLKAEVLSYVNSNTSLNKKEMICLLTGEVAENKAMADKAQLCLDKITRS